MSNVHAPMLDKALAVAVDHLRPPPVETLPQWIERVVRLPEGLSAEPGPVTLWPPQGEIATSIGDPAVERVTWLKSVRSGFTFIAACAVARHVLDDPCPAIVLMPTESDARGIVVDDLEPLFDASPDLRGLLPEPSRDERGRSTLLQRFYPGGSLKVISSKAARNLRRHTARCVYADEVDAMECAEGDPLKLAERRTLTYRNRKLVAGSSPKDDGTSLIAKLYAESDQRVFEIECPHCASPFELLWRHIQWPDGKPEEAHAVCPECGGVIEEGEHKAKAVEAGRWRATRPEVQGHHGYRSNALVSTLDNCAWGKLAREFLAAKDDPDLLRAFVTTILAEPWREDAVEATNEDELAESAEPISLDAIPEDVLALTCGVDVQDDRLEASTVGWSRDGVPSVLDHRTIWGAPDDNDTWLELDEHLRGRWRHPHSGWLKIDATCVDAGSGSHFDQVERFCRPRTPRRVFAIKGASGMGRPAIMRSRTKGRLLFIVGVDGIKTSILGKLAKPGAIRFSDQLEAIYFEQLCSERKVTRMSRGRPVVAFERVPGRAAEALDALVYATAARSALQLDFHKRETELASPVPPTPRPQTVVRSEFMARGRL